MNYEKKDTGQIITLEDFARVPKTLQDKFAETEKEPTHFVANAHPGDTKTGLTATFGLRPLRQAGA